jgi:carboxymethylenebutenolidase
MCYGDDARPPLPPIRGGADDRGRTTLTSADGTTCNAYFAHPDTSSDLGMIVLPDVRGLHHFYEELAVRFAEAGFHAIAIDYFGRTAKTDDRGEDFPFMEHVQQLQPPKVSDDVAAAAAFLRAIGGGNTVRSVSTVGFCMGGSISWNQSAAGLGLAGCIGFYGQPSRAVDAIPRMEAPLLVLAAGKDFTPVVEVESFVEQARVKGVDVELAVYPDAPHSFFDRGFAEHQDACADAWQRILAFTAAHRTA